MRELFWRLAETEQISPEFLEPPEHILPLACKHKMPNELLVNGCPGDAVKLPRSERQELASSMLQCRDVRALRRCQRAPSICEEQLRAGFRFDCRCPVCVAASPELGAQLFSSCHSKLADEHIICLSTGQIGNGSG